MLKNRTTCQHPISPGRHVLSACNPGGRRRAYPLPRLWSTVYKTPFLPSSVSFVPLFEVLNLHRCGDKHCNYCTNQAAVCQVLFTSQKFCKIFQITRHIESLEVYMKH